MCGRWLVKGQKPRALWPSGVPRGFSRYALPRRVGELGGFAREREQLYSRQQRDVPLCAERDREKA